MKQWFVRISIKGFVKNAVIALENLYVLHIARAKH